MLVVTADGKGVPMRRPLEERVRAPHRRGKGEKADGQPIAAGLTDTGILVHREHPFPLAAESFPQARVVPEAVGILDLFHVLERLWLAAYCFHAEGSKAAEAFVEERLRMLLEGKVGGLIGG